MKISAIIITKNPGQMIRRCVESVAWTDEIIVVDSGSTDNTEEISSEYGVHFFRTPDFPGHGPQKNRALDLTTGDWVLSIDQDEWITPELCEEIRAILRSPGDVAAFNIPRLSSYCGHDMRHSGWWPDPVTRLFRRGAARFSEDHVHDRLVVNGTIGQLKCVLRHEPMPTLEHVINKMNQYSTAGAKFQFNRGKRATLSKAIGHGVWAFVRTYFLKAGFLDGRAGFMLAVSNAEGAYYRYLKLMLLGDKPR